MFTYSGRMSYLCHALSGNLRHQVDVLSSGSTPPRRAKTSVHDHPLRPCRMQLCSFGLGVIPVDPHRVGDLTLDAFVRGRCCHGLQALSGTTTLITSSISEVAQKRRRLDNLACENKPDLLSDTSLHHFAALFAAPAPLQAIYDVMRYSLQVAMRQQSIL